MKRRNETLQRLTTNQLSFRCFFFLCLGLTLFSALWADPAHGAADNITKRLANLESRWGHLQLAGEFSLLADYKQRAFEEYHTPDFKNYLNLYLDAQIDRNFYFYLLLSHYDNYGYLNQLYVRGSGGPVPLAPVIGGSGEIPFYP